MLQARDLKPYIYLLGPVNNASSTQTVTVLEKLFYFTFPRDILKLLARELGHRFKQVYSKRFLLYERGDVLVSDCFHCLFDIFVVLLCFLCTI